MKKITPNYKNTRIYLVITVFLLLLLTTGIVIGLFFLFSALNLAPSWNLFTVLFFLIGSVVIGTALSALVGEIVVRPYRKLMEATEEIAAGNFDVRVAITGPLEARKLADSFNRMAQELGSIETMRSDFVSNVSHEFKTPAASIKGFAKLLKKDTLSPENRHAYLDTIIKEADRLTHLTHNALLLSKVERQEILTEKSDFYLDEQLRKAALLLQQEWEQKDLTLTTDLQKCLLRGDEELLMQVWINLISNAIKFTPAGGSIDLRLGLEEHRAVVRVADSGVGMDEEALRHIFDKFYQADASHSVAGNGLGLALVKRIVHISGGHMSVESVLGQGSSFYVYLPRG